MTDYVNSDGLEIRISGPKAEQSGAGTQGSVKELVVDISDMATDITAAAFSHEASIPAGSYIIGAYLRVTSAMTGTSGTLTIGLAQKDGTAIDADGIDVAIAQADLAAGKAVLCNGALVGGVVTTGSTPGYVYTTKGGTVTAGAARLVIEYI